MPGECLIHSTLGGGVTWATYLQVTSVPHSAPPDLRTHLIFSPKLKISISQWLTISRTQHCWLLTDKQSKYLQLRFKLVCKIFSIFSLCRQSLSEVTEISKIIGMHHHFAVFTTPFAFLYNKDNGNRAGVKSECSSSETNIYLNVTRSHLLPYVRRPRLHWFHFAIDQCLLSCYAIESGY